MATAQQSSSLKIRRFPVYNHVDAVRFLPPVSALGRFVAAACYDPDSYSSSLRLFSLHHNLQTFSPDLRPHYTFPIPSRISSLSLSQPPRQSVASTVLSAVATRSGSLHQLVIDPVQPSRTCQCAIADKSFHEGPISAVDVQPGGLDCVTVGREGRVNLVKNAPSRMSYARVGDTKGLTEFTAVRWGSECEFATGSLGFGVQWWDRRKPGGMVKKLTGFNMSQGAKSGFVHSIDIHPSRKHMCVVGGSSGTVFAWDIRWSQCIIPLSSLAENKMTPASSQSEVWKVQYDSYVQIPNTGSTKLLPVVMCSEDGILAVLEPAKNPVQIQTEPCAINSFDIDPQKPSDMICSLEWESIAILRRP